MKRQNIYYDKIYMSKYIPFMSKIFHNLQKKSIRIQYMHVRYHEIMISDIKQIMCIIITLNFQVFVTVYSLQTFSHIRRFVLIRFVTSYLISVDLLSLYVLSIIPFVFIGFVLLNCMHLSFVHAIKRLDLRLEHYLSPTM